MAATWRPRSNVLTARYFDDDADISFNAPALKGQTVTIDTVQVQDALGDLLIKSDLSRFIL